MMMEGAAAGAILPPIPVSRRMPLHSKIGIVGGGAGGLELACKLGRKLGPEKVMLVGMESTGIYWKPVYYVLEDRVPVWVINA